MLQEVDASLGALETKRTLLPHSTATRGAKRCIHVKERLQEEDQQIGEKCCKTHLHDQVKVVCGLERIMKRDDEGMVGDRQDLLLG